MFSPQSLSLLLLQEWCGLRAIHTIRLKVDVSVCSPESRMRDKQYITSSAGVRERARKVLVPFLSSAKELLVF